MILDNLKKFKVKIKNKKNLVGGWIQTSSPDIVEIISHSNFDWICIDLEHGASTLKDLPNLLRATAINKKVTFVRSKSKNINEIVKIIDIGAHGIIVPKIETKKDVLNIKNAIYYPPKGNRGVGFSRANMYSKNFSKYYEASKDIIFVGMIESKTGVENLDEILKLNVLDVIFVGPMDLKNSIDPKLNFKSKKYLDYLNKIKNICKKYKQTSGIHILEKNFKNKKSSFTFNAYLTDTIVIGEYKKK